MAAERLYLQRGETSAPDPAALLADRGIEATLISSEAGLESIPTDTPLHLVLVDVTSMPTPELRQCVRRCSQMNLPVIALVPEGRLDTLDPTTGIDDFVVSPPQSDELVARARMVLRRRATSLDDAGALRSGDLVISPTRYEVTLKGKRIDLTFKEYKLLSLLATNPGRAYTRETLLSKIWEYDYFGGTRTVDVHIRRLRSKLEDADHSFIETIWNVGYRFRDRREHS